MYCRLHRHIWLYGPVGKLGTPVWTLLLLEPSFEAVLMVWSLAQDLMSLNLGTLEVESLPNHRVGGLAEPLSLMATPSLPMSLEMGGGVETTDDLESDVLEI